MVLVKTYHLKCPSCKSEHTLRSSRARNLKEKIFKAVSFYEIYKCKKCGWRGWKINFALDRKIFKKLLLYLILMMFAAFIIYNVLKMVV